MSRENLYLARMANDQEKRGADDRDHAILQYGKESDAISGGNYGKTREFFFSKDEGGILQLVQKKFHADKFSTKRIDAQLEIYRILKEHHIKTFDDFYTDGESLYSTLLNKGGIIALSSNNPLPVKNEVQERERVDNLMYGIKINNLDTVIDKLIEQAILLPQTKLSMWGDTLFFLVPENHQSKPVDIDIDFVIGDFDMIKHTQDTHEYSAKKTLHHFTVNLIAFIQTYGNLNEKNDYLKIINQRIPSQLTNGQILVQSGVKELQNYAPTDGAIIDACYDDMNHSTSQKELDALSHVVSMDADLSLVSDKYKNILEKWAGSFYDTEHEVPYEKLTSVGGSVRTPITNHFLMNHLHTVGGDIVALNTLTFSAFFNPDDTSNWKKAHHSDKLVLSPTLAKQAHEKVVWL